MPTCIKCKKYFKYESLLKRHLNNKISCDIKKKEYKCEICNINCTRPSHLKIHETSKRHIENYNKYNIQFGNNCNNNTVNINPIQNNIYLNIQMNPFSETNIEILENDKFKKELENEKIKKVIKNIGNEEYENRELILNSTLELIVKIFKKLNFNLLYEKNHNCNIVILCINKK